MKRFLVFAGQTYYANGGWKDFHCDYATIEEANEAFDGIVKEHPRRVIKRSADWAHIVDCETGDRVRDHGDGGY